MAELHGGNLIEGVASETTDTDVQRAVDVAAKAFRDYRRLTPKRRAAFLRAIANELEVSRDAIVAQAQRETGFDDTRLNSELSRCVRTCEAFATVAGEDAWRDVVVDTPAQQVDRPATPDLRRMLIPVGPVAVFGASNVPLMGGTLGTDTVAAIAAGCPVVVRGHPAHPGISELLATATITAAQATDVPSGVFGLLQGAEHAVGLALVRADGIKAVAFTGSLNGGRALFDAAAARPEPVPVYAEMGSVNPIFVLPKGSGDGLADGLANAVTRAGGQLCTKPGVVAVPDQPESDLLVAAVRARIESSPPVPMLHAGVQDAYTRRLDEFTQTPGVEVVTRVSGGAVLTCQVKTYLDEPALRSEVFGPAVLFVRYSTPDDLLAIAGRLDGELTASVHGTEEELAQLDELIDDLATKVGRVLWNSYPTGTPESVAMHHGGPYPAATDPRYTSIGSAAIRKFVRPIAYQNFPERLLPRPLRDDDA